RASPRMSRSSNWPNAILGWRTISAPPRAANRAPWAIPPPCCSTIRESNRRRTSGRRSSVNKIFVDGYLGDGYMKDMKSRLSNLLALAVLALLFERPMHPYEMAATLKQRHKHESIKLRYGTLYTVIELLIARRFIRAKETSRDGKRPERTVYTLTALGADELRDWMRELLR